LYNDSVDDLQASLIFRVPFNGGRQYYEVHLHDCSVRTFNKWAKTNWGFYWGDRKPRNRYRGYFCDVHLLSYRVTLPTVSHELWHVVKWWAEARGLDLNSNRREEDIAWVVGEIFGNFYREYGKVTE
jgi:hypothetical protein